MTDQIKIDTILIHSIGWGCDSFYQVIKRTPKSVRARKLNVKSIRVDVRCQTCEYLPIKNNFYEDPRGNEYEEVTLKIKDNGDIGPSKRMMWWDVWDKKAKKQYSS